MAGITPLPGGGLRLQMSVPGSKSVDVALNRFGEAVSDFRPFFRDYAAPLIFERVQANMDSQGGWVGGWAPLTPWYRLWKIRRVGNKPILQFTGRLKNSLTWNGTTVGPEGIARISETKAEFGTSVPYALAHQVGASPGTRAYQMSLPGTIKPRKGRARVGGARAEALRARTGLPKRQIIKLPESETMGRLLQRFVVDQKNATLGQTSAKTA